MLGALKHEWNKFFLRNWTIAICIELFEDIFDFFLFISELFHEGHDLFERDRSISIRVKMGKGLFESLNCKRFSVKKTSCKKLSVVNFPTSICVYNIHQIIDSFGWNFMFLFQGGFQLICTDDTIIVFVKLPKKVN